MGGLFGNLFDLNRDGKLNAAERALDYTMFRHVMDESDGSVTDSTSIDYTSTEVGCEAEEKLGDAGIDPWDFELMDDDERRDALEDAGLDFDDLDW